MKKHVILLSAVLLLCLFSHSSHAAEPKFYIGIASTAISQGEDAFLGAKHMERLYGIAGKGGMIRLVVTPENFATEQSRTISCIVSLADDPKIKVIVVNEAIPGTAEAFRRIKSKRPDILCLAGEPHETPANIAETSDLAVGVDNIIRGYLIVHTAKKLGAETFVHISFPRHMGYELLARRRDIMERTCKELGVKFVSQSAPDPAGSSGMEGASRYLNQKVPVWVQQYGQKTAFFTTNNGHTESVIKQVAKHGGFFIEPDLPSPLMGYPGAFGLNLTKEAGNWPAIMKKVESAVLAAGGKGRLGTWAYSYGWSTTCALTELGKRVVEGKAKTSNMKDLWASYQQYTPGAKWNGGTYVDPTGNKVKSLVLVYQDTYIFGRGNMHTTAVKIPSKIIMGK